MHSGKIKAAFNEEQTGLNPFCSLDWVIIKVKLCLALIICSKMLRRTGVTVIPLSVSGLLGSAFLRIGVRMPLRQPLCINHI